jgi:hypothetical protein
MINDKRLKNIILILLSLFILCTYIGCVGTIIEEIYLGAPVVKQEQDKWCLPAATKSVMNYHGMEITQKEIADYVIDEEGVSHTAWLINNASKLGINANLDANVSFNKIKNELIKANPMILISDYSLTNKTDHAYLIDGFDDTKEKLRLMCPNRGYVYWAYDYVTQLNNNFWIDQFEKESDTFCIIFVSPKNISSMNNFTSPEKAIQIVSEKTDLFDIFR